MRIQHNKTFSVIVIILCIVVASVAQSRESQLVSLRVKANFADVASLMHEAIQDKGLITVNTFFLSDMLNRTAKAYGIDKKTYGNAIKIEFCSAEIAHKLTKENYANIALCPFSISLFTLGKDPEHVHISYMKPMLGGKSSAATRMAHKLIKEIIQEAISW